MLRPPPRSTPTDPRFPHTTLCRSTLRSLKQRRGRLGGDLPRSERSLGSLRAGGKAGRSRIPFPTLAFRPFEDRRADHRLQDRHRRDAGRALSGGGSEKRVLPRTPERPERDLMGAQTTGDRRSEERRGGERVGQNVEVHVGAVIQKKKKK